MIVRVSSRLLLAASLCVLGCSDGPDEGAGGGAAGPAAAGVGKAGRPGAGPASAAPSTANAPLTPVPVASGKIALTPENTSIGFVGTHTGARPDPRVGGFGQFQGTVEVDPATRALKSASVEIQTDSLWTQIPQLTTHLKSPDFFNTREHPTARFQSTSIAAGAQPGEYTMTGDLTLHATTRPVSFPAKVEVGDSGLTLTGNLTLDRTEFGMDRVQDRVEKEVTVTLAVGRKTEPLPASGGFGGGGRRGGPGGPGGPGGAGGRRGPGGPGGPGGPPAGPSPGQP